MLSIRAAFQRFNFYIGGNFGGAVVNHNSLIKGFDLFTFDQNHITLSLDKQRGGSRGRDKLDACHAQAWRLAENIIIFLERETALSSKVALLLLRLIKMRSWNIFLVDFWRLYFAAFARKLKQSDILILRRFSSAVGGDKESTAMGDTIAMGLLYLAVKFDSKAAKYRRTPHSTRSKLDHLSKFHY